MLWGNADLIATGNQVKTTGKAFNSIIYLQDNAHLHSPMQFKIYENSSGISSIDTCLCHLSSDISLCDFAKYDEFKKALRGHFQSGNDLKNVVLKIVLRTNPGHLR